MERVDDSEFTPEQWQAGFLHLDYVVCGMVLNYRQSSDLRVRIARSFLAKGAMLARSIFYLWNIGAVQECYILCRCLLDRVLHLHKLESENSFASFDDWCFVEGYEFESRMQNDSQYADQGKKHRPLSTEDSNRLKALRRQKVSWEKPKAKKMANEMGQEALYTSIYDFGSKMAHPMANEGVEYYEILTGLESNDEFPSRIEVLRNTLMCLLALALESVSAVRPLMNDAPIVLMEFIARFSVFLYTGEPEYQDTYQDLIRIFDAETPWVSLKSTTEGVES